MAGDGDYDPRDNKWLDYLNNIRDGHFMEANGTK